MLINVVEISNGNKPYGRGGGSNSGKICTHYGKSRHIVDVCNSKHDFLLNFIFKDQGANHNVISGVPKEIDN